MASQPEFRIGQGIDVHPFIAGRPLIIGGIRIQHPLGLEGHSDADVLLHAVMDALLGAAGEGDIGDFFPNTDPKWLNSDSKDLLRVVFQKVKQSGWQVVNLDCSIGAEAPKLKPHISQMRECLGKLLEIEPARCNIKATTFEGLGFIGRREGVVAMAVCLLVRN